MILLLRSKAAAPPLQKLFNRFVQPLDLTVTSRVRVQQRVERNYMQHFILRSEPHA
jgi:hypothetical protein